MWSDPLPRPPERSVEIWRIINTTGDAHRSTSTGAVQILERRHFDINQYPPIVYDQPPQPPENNERPAWKDTVLSYPETVTRVIARYDLPSAAHRGRGQKFAGLHTVSRDEETDDAAHDVIGKGRGHERIVLVAAPWPRRLGGTADINCLPGRDLLRPGQRRTSWCRGLQGEGCSRAA
jgi:hypothetical protein